MPRQLTSLRLADYSDRELLLIVVDLGEEDGWAPAQAIADRLQIKTQYPVRAVGSRLSWLNRYGAVEREYLRDEHGDLILTPRSNKPKPLQRWRLTERGHALAIGRLSVPQARNLDKLSDDQLLLVTRWLAERQRATDDTAATLLRREWTYGTHPLRHLNGRP